jgi:hypothetical protein
MYLFCLKNQNQQNTVFLGIKPLLSAISRLLFWPICAIIKRLSLFLGALLLSFSDHEICL